MAVLAGKTQTERNKIIAAGILGLVALIALYFAFGRNLFGGSTATATTAKSSPTPKPIVTAANRPDAVLPSSSEQDFTYQTTPVVYNAASANAPDPGRNIFAFYEPPPPTPWVPTPPPTPKPTATPIPPTPAPTPPMLVQGANPATVYAGTQAFQLEVLGNMFTPESRVYFNQTELKTTFASAQRLTGEVPAKLIVQDGAKQIIVQTADGQLYSNPFNFLVQAPPKPSLQYIGMIGRKRYNNDTAYFTTGTAQSTAPPFGARLNDVVGGRFRLVDISSAEVMLEDTQLGFRYKIQLTKASAAPGNGQPVRPDGGFSPYNPNGIPQGDIPGIPGNIQRYVPPQQPPQPKQQKQDVDDDGDGG